MHVTLVHVSVKDAHVNDFIEACRLNHEASIKENGNRRFDILQSAEEPTKFVLYEAYVGEAEAKAHKETQHYHAWRETVADWMAEPRKGVAYQGVFPKQ
ncbi:MAG: antibiotic biosynthesis monooxygenase [Gammaproteobacteria bacterium]|nr:antibiotic biosynthesis monooxygenase [Gammaproteobacteria bacterium]